MENEVLLIDLQRGIYYSARFGTAQIVSDLLYGYGREEILARWRDKGHSPAGLAERVDRLAGYLQEQSLGVESSGGPQSGAPFLELGQDPAFPEVEQFEDMKEIFEMDPIHDGNLERGWPVHN
jgi:hypothetical protein